MKDVRCIDPEVGKLTGYYEVGLLKGSERERFEIHLINCTHCFNETFKSQPIIESLRIKTPALVTQIQRKQALSHTPIPQNLFSLRNSRSWAGLTLLALVVMAAGVYIYVEKERYTGAESGRTGTSPVIKIHGLLPRGELTQRPTRLEWTPIAHATNYQVEIFDEKKKSIWRKETNKPILALPEEVRARLVAGGTYTWAVRAFPQNLSSLPITFTIPKTPDKPR